MSRETLHEIVRVVHEGEGMYIVWLRCLVDADHRRFSVEVAAGGAEVWCPYCGRRVRLSPTFAAEEVGDGG